MAATTRDLEAPAMVNGSELVTITRWQARAWEQTITAAYHPDQPPPAAWVEPDRPARRPGRLRPGACHPPGR